MNRKNCRKKLHTGRSTDTKTNTRPQLDNLDYGFTLEIEYASTGNSYPKNQRKRQSSSRNLVQIKTSLWWTVINIGHRNFTNDSQYKYHHHCIVIRDRLTHAKIKIICMNKCVCEENVRTESKREHVLPKVCTRVSLAVLRETRKPLSEQVQSRLNPIWIQNTMITLKTKQMDVNERGVTWVLTHLVLKEISGQNITITCPTEHFQNEISKKFSCDSAVL